MQLLPDKWLDFKQSCIEWLKSCSNTINGHPEDCKECTIAFREHLQKLVMCERSNIDD